MKTGMRLLFLNLCFLFLISPAGTQTDPDSMVKKRDSLLDDYASFKSRMKERTWLNIIDMNLRAEKIIETDNILIKDLISRNYETEREFNRHIKVLSDSLHVLQNSCRSLLQQKDALERTNTYLTTGVVSAFAVTVLLLAFLIIAWRKLRKYRLAAEKAGALKGELDKEVLLLRENLKSRDDVIRNTDARLSAEMASLRSDLEKYRAATGRLEAERLELHGEISLWKEKAERQERMILYEKELRQQMEQKISDLIEQLRKKLV